MKKKRSRVLALCAALVALSPLMIAGCSNESQSVPTSPQANFYIQLDRLGRPGIKEIFEPFADHNSSDRAIPSNDLVLKGDIASFPLGASDATAVATFYPDVLRMNLMGTSARYLGIELGGNVFGGRALTDDVMSADLNLAFAASTTARKPCLTTDNVAASPALTASASGAFPYLPAPQ